MLSALSALCFPQQTGVLDFQQHSKNLFMMIWEIDLTEPFSCQLRKRTKGLVLSQKARFSDACNSSQPRIN